MPYFFTTLHSHQHLLEKSVELLNEEWPRSKASREHSQKKSCRNLPPMAFLLLDEENGDELIGHARTCILPNRATALWIESVLIKKQYRGKKLGKKLMNGVEDWMIENGFDEAFLSTDDQVEFYKSCGYKECDPIVHSTTATSVFPAMDHFQNKAAVVSPVIVKHSTPTTTTLTSNASSIPTPPPLPPLKPPKSSISTIDHQYMHKKLK